MSQNQTVKLPVLRVNRDSGQIGDICAGDVPFAQIQPQGTGRNPDNALRDAYAVAVVRACNEHAALVAVANQLQTLLNLIDGENEGGDGILEDDLRNAQNALATLSTIQTTLP